MRFLGSSILLVSLALAACSASTQSVEVRITPDAYQVGNVKSALATPAVDEVVRLNPKNVLMVLCRTTPPAKAIQFQTELSARHKAELQATRTDQGCPAQALFGQEPTSTAFPQWSCSAANEAPIV